MHGELPLGCLLYTSEMELPMGKEFLTWDEFSPALYKLTAKLTNGKQTDTQQVQFGMRDFKIEGKWFYVNGRKTMLRGTVENCDFPLTCLVYTSRVMAKNYNIPSLPMKSSLPEDNQKDYP